MCLAGRFRGVVEMRSSVSDPNLSSAQVVPKSPPKLTRSSSSMNCRERPRGPAAITPSRRRRVTVPAKPLTPADEPNRSIALDLLHKQRLMRHLVHALTCTSHDPEELTEELSSGTVMYEDCEEVRAILTHIPNCRASMAKAYCIEVENCTEVQKLLLHRGSCNAPLCPLCKAEAWKKEMGIRKRRKKRTNATDKHLAALTGGGGRSNSKSGAASSPAPHKSKGPSTFDQKTDVLRGAHPPSRRLQKKLKPSSLSSVTTRPSTLNEQGGRAFPGPTSRTSLGSSIGGGLMNSIVIDQSVAARNAQRIGMPTMEVSEDDEDGPLMF